MNEVQRNLLKVLSYSIFGLKPSRGIDNMQNCNWNGLLKEAQLQGVYLFVFDSVKDVIIEELDEDKLNYYTSLYYRVVSKNINNAYYHRKLNTLFSRNNIPYVIIKGQASGSYYPNPKLRSSGDIDFLVSPENIERAGALLEEIGYLKVNEKVEHDFHIAYYNSIQTIEMHWKIGGVPMSAVGDICRGYLNDIIETEKKHDGMMIPDDFHHGLILLLHTARHMLNTGIGIKHLCDWAVYVSKVDVSKYEIQLRKVGLWRFAQLLTQVSIQYLGCPIQKWAMVNIDNELLEEVVDDFFAAGEFGIKNPDRINEAKIMTTNAQGNVGNNSFLQLFRMLTEKAQKALPICDKYGLLIPFGWIYVGIRHLVMIVQGRRPPIHVREMIDGAEKRRRIYKKFELFEV